MNTLMKSVAAAAVVISCGIAYGEGPERQLRVGERIHSYFGAFQGAAVQTADPWVHKPGEFFQDLQGRICKMYVSGAKYVNIDVHKEGDRRGLPMAWVQDGDLFVQWGQYVLKHDPCYRNADFLKGHITTGRAVLVPNRVMPRWLPPTVHPEVAPVIQKARIFESEWLVVGTASTSEVAPPPPVEGEWEVVPPKGSNSGDYNPPAKQNSVTPRPSLTVPTPSQRELELIAPATPGDSI